MSTVFTSLASSVAQLPFQAIQNTLSSNQHGKGVNSLSSVSPSPDSSQLSPFAQLLSTLQQLQQTDPAKYSQATQQISANLQTAAQTAQSEGNAAAATQLNQLSSDFSTAFKTGQLPSVQNLASAVGGHHHHHNHHAETAGSNSAGSTAAPPQTSSLDAVQIALDTLKTSGN
jgi:hypothetical protein